MTELRDAFFYALLAKARRDKNVVLMTADMGAYAVRAFAEELPEQFFNVGIAEQNMISVAAGLALKGKQVYCYAISAFLVLRAFEQIKIDVCNMRSNVILVGVGGGVDYSYDGSTHHCPNDIGILRTLPNLGIYVPFDVYTTELSTQLVGPMYIRLPKMLRLLDELHATNVGLLVLTQLKPLPKAWEWGPLLNGTRFMVVEQHTVHGGLLSALGERKMMEHLYGGYVGYADVFSDLGGSIDVVEKNAGVDYERVKKCIQELQYAN
jgi:transketolase C-terminal domain/subunit